MVTSQSNGVPFRGLDRRIWIIASARSINTMGFSLVMPFLFMYLVEDRGQKAALVGSIYTVAGVFASTSQLVAGELADRLGRRRIMLSALLLRTLNMLALGLAVLLPAPVAVVGLLVVTNGILRGQFEPAAQAMIADVAAPDRRVAAFALQRMGVNLGWAIGPALGGALAAVGGYGTMFFVAAAVTLAAAIATHWLRDAPRTARPTEKTPLSARTVYHALRENPAFVSYLLLVLLGATMTVQLFSTMSVYAKTELGLSRAEIGLLYTVNGVLVLLLQIPAVRLIERGGPARALLFGPALYAVAYAAVGQAGSFGTLAVAVAVLTAGEVVFAPALSDMAAYLGDPRRMGRAFGLFGLMQQLGVAIGPSLGGAVYDRYRGQPAVMWGVFAGGMALVGAGYAWFARRWLPSSP